MSSVGGITVDIIRGRPASLKNRVDTWEVEGIDGVGAQLLGLGDGEFSFATVLYCASEPAAESHIDAMENLQGQVITIIDDFGESYANVLIKHVDAQNAKQPTVYQGNASARRVQIQFTAVTSS